MGERGRVLMVAALEVELAAIVRRGRLRRAGEFRTGVIQGRPVTAMVTGMGGVRAAEAVVRAVEQVGVTGVVNVGFAGGLGPEMRVGETVMPLLIGNEAGERLRLHVSGPTAERAWTHPDDATRPALVSVRAPVLTAAGKAALRETSGAQMVDMEAYYVARALLGRGVRFYVLKAISDEAGTELPAEMSGWVDERGRSSAWAAVKWAGVRRARWRQLLQMGRAAERASAALWAGLGQVMMAM